MSASINTLLSMMQAVTGLTLDDIEKEVLAETPEERTKVQVLNARKMHAHQTGIPLDEVPDYLTYPDTGRPPKT